MTDKEIPEELQGVGKRIQALREALRLTQRDFAASLGISSPYVSNLESKPLKKPAPILFYKIAVKYNVNLNYLMLGKGEMFQPDPDEDKDVAENKELSLEFPNGISNLKELLRMLKLLPYFQNILVATADELFVKHREMIDYKLNEVAKKRARAKEQADKKENQE